MLKIKKIHGAMALSLFSFLIAGCSSVGPKLIPDNRENFNNALVNSDEKQLLLNIVRMQFGDRPYFLNVDSITTSNSLSLSSNANFGASQTKGNHVF